MFVDVDDPVETSHPYYQLHAAHVCDIEQPAFVSGQHVLVLELFNVTTTTTLELAAKLHLRYPFPSVHEHQWIDLPAPQLLLVSNNGTLFHSPLQDDDSSSMGLHLERVWVAAGNDDDYDLVMWTTILACWLGVIWMLQDISYVSQWDDA